MMANPTADVLDRGGEARHSSGEPEHDISPEAPKHRADSAQEIAQLGTGSASNIACVRRLWLVS